MRLSWNEIRARAKVFSEDWKDAHYEKGETQPFYEKFFDIFGVSRRSVGIYEKRVENLETGKRGFIDLFWPGTLIVEQKSAGRNLKAAQSQAFNYFDWLPERDQPKFILASDFQNFTLLDLDERTETSFALAELHDHIELFAFILGRKRSYGIQQQANIDAAELMGKLHDALKDSGYEGHELELLLVRLLFCLFADDTGIFEPKDIFLQLIEERTAENGNDVGRWLNDLFDVLDTVEPKRQNTLDPELQRFPYINGALFTGRLKTPAFDAKMRDSLIEAARFNWSSVSPAIFGSLFQSVMKAEERRKKGAHYTSESNIMKVIGPLVLDDLHADFVKLKARRSGRDAALREFQKRLGRLTFLDPACGCGNFLVIAYRELRALELAVLHALWDGQRVTDIALFSLVNVDQFYGIEYEEFPARIAEVAMWMTDHLANNELSLAFGQSFARIPLKQSATIKHGDALETDWNDVLPAEKCSYVMGNPPFVGQSYQSLTQREQMAKVINLPSKRAGSLDYVTAWFIKAGQYLQPNRRIRIAFVSTNSITQGEQVAQLWPILFDRSGLEIMFAHRTFSWGSEARGAAHVHVVIIGLTHRDNEPDEKRLFSYPDIKGEPVETQHKALTAYLFDAQNVANRHLVIRDERAPLCDVTPMRMGSKIVDNGLYLFDPIERQHFLGEEPDAERFMVPVVGSQEYIRGESRWILRLDEASPAELKALPRVADRVRAVREYRAASKKEGTRKLADYPTQFEVTTIPTAPYLAIPKVSGERRDYIPIGWLEPPSLPSQLLQVVLEADGWMFGILTSKMHMAWMAHVGGRLKSDYQYSIGIIYNTFPWPDATPAQRTKVEALAQAVLDARASHLTSSLADLYDPDTMPANLRRAHTALDSAVDRLYRAAAFASDRDRVEHLFGRYEALVNPLEREAVKQNTRVARKTAKAAVAEGGI
jgi:N-6 DNA Methylase